MSIDTLYAFFVDDAMLLKSSGSGVQIDVGGNRLEQGYGILNGEPANYLVNLGKLLDPRQRRLDLIDSGAPTGSAKLLFDTNRFGSSKLSGMNSYQANCYFNVVERIVYQQEYTDDNLNHMLVNTGSFEGYVANSFMHGDANKTITISTVKSTTGVRVKVQSWVSFDFTYINEKNEEIIFKTHLWLSKAAFKDEYPYVTITKVIPPYDPKVLAGDPQVVQNSASLSVLQNSSSFIFTESDLETAALDQNGIYTYTTKYALSSTSSVDIKFGLAYCGRQHPTTLVCREAIKQYLIDNANATLDSLKELFPELFIAHRFYIIPLWDQYRQFSDREVYRSIINIKELTDIANNILPWGDDSFVSKYSDVILNAHNKMFSVAIPDTSNEEAFSILTLHPTYQNYSSQVVNWKFMTAETQAFAAKLNLCMAILSGEETSTAFVETVIDGVRFLSFTSGSGEYLVMTKDSYLSLRGV